MNTRKYMYKDYKDRMQKIADIKYAAAVLQWDQETYLPQKGNHWRGQQISTLSELAHQLFTSEDTRSIIQDLLESNHLNKNEKQNVALSWEDYQRNFKIPTSFVKELSVTINKSYHDWIEARKENNFRIFQDSLAKIVELKKKEADLLGYRDHPYSALMNDYDKGLTVETTDSIFSDLSKKLLPILDFVKTRQQVDNQFLHKNFEKNKQWEFGLGLLKNMHFDFEAGRQDISEHPFTTNFNSADVRVTTRIDEHDLANMVWSCIHEGGHALYEQGLPYDEYGMPLGEYCSLSIHESQSRLWENCIGRSLEYWEFHFPVLQSYFPEALSKLDAFYFYKGINRIEPSLIRTEADELTYHFHVIIRYEIEKKLIEGSIQTKDIPAIWEEYYLKYLGIRVPNDKSGCLQDVHWSHGSFGYFATYSIGSLYAAQFWNKIKSENSNVVNEIQSGNSSFVHHWLKKEIFSHGRAFSSNELCKHATGETLQPDYFISYLKNKITSVYE